MSRTTYVQVKNEDGSWGLVPKDELIQQSDVNAPMVMGDIEPYRSVLDGSIVGSRSAHRAHMRQHGVIEVGNEKLNRPMQKAYDPGTLKQDLARAIDETTRR